MTRDPQKTDRVSPPYKPPRSLLHCSTSLDLIRYPSRAPRASGLTVRADHYSLSAAVSLQHSLGILQNCPNLGFENGGVNVEFAKYFESTSVLPCLQATAPTPFLDLEPSVNQTKPCLVISCKPPFHLLHSPIVTVYALSKNHLV